MGDQVTLSSKLKQPRIDDEDAEVTELIQIPVQGLHFTWHNSQIGDATVLRKLDWAFGNQNFIMKWPLSTATFQTRVASDHNPIIVSLLLSPPRQKSKFRFLNLWTRQEGYEEMVQSAWTSEAYSNPISRLTTKLRTLKGVLSNFHRTHSTRIESVKQRRLDSMRKKPWTCVPMIGKLTDRREQCHLYNKLSADKESFYRQRSRIQWLTLGDKNTTFFHRSLTHRRSRNRIHNL
ncbi:hypothetical protein DKX38_017572 [Salix brachista]|uniref:Endonuclease/exonuclease/phosphatase domain-containing protein n=1 Tax=Salix brachista TaxID=2182728 RepID=A0A5N5KWY9_9ROSI|nr:hypothetical protein DKX38_017572 [Salix brachista]